MYFFFVVYFNGMVAFPPGLDSSVVSTNRDTVLVALTKSVFHFVLQNMQSNEYQIG